MKRIAIYNEKSGVGKTFLTLALAKFLQENYNVIIGDTIQGQRGLSPKRELELKKAELSPAHRSQIVEIQDVSTPTHIESISNLNKYDYLLLDTGGTSQSTFDLLFECDLVILVCDTYGEDEEMKLDLKVFDAFRDITFEKEIRLKEIYIIFNKVKNETVLNTQLLDEFNYLENSITYSNAYLGMTSTITKLPNNLDASQTKSLYNTLMQLQNLIVESTTTKAG